MYIFGIKFFRLQMILQKFARTCKKIKLYSRRQRNYHSFGVLIQSDSHLIVKGKTVNVQYYRQRQNGGHFFFNVLSQNGEESPGDLINSLLEHVLRLQ